MNTYSISKIFSNLWIAPAFKGTFRHLTKYPPSETNSEIIWKSQHKTVYKHTLPRKYEAETIVWKEYLNSRFWRFFLRPSFAAREFEGFRIAAKIGIPVPRVLAFGDTRSWSRLKNSFIVMDFVNESRNGFDFCPEGPLFKDNARKAYCKLNIQYLAQLHNAGYIHGAALPQNILWKIGRDSRLEIFWIDLDKVRARSGRRFRKGAKNDLKTFLNPFEFDRETAEQMINYYNRVRKSLSSDAQTIEI